MKITDVLAGSQKKPLPPMQRKVLKYLEAHPDEVFTYRDAQLASVLGLKPTALAWSLWALQRKGLIANTKVGKIYFGCKRAVGELARRRKSVSRP